MAFPKNKQMPKKRGAFDDKLNRQRQRGKRPYNNEGRPPASSLDGPPRGPKGKPRRQKSPQDKGPGGNKPMRLGAVGNYPGVSRRYVNRLTGGLIRDEVRDLARDKQRVRRESEYLTNQANAQYERGLGDLNYVHGEVGDYLTGMGQRNQQMYAGQAQVQADQSAALQQQLAGTFQGAQDNTMAELARLGITQGGNMSGLMADQAFQQAQGAQAGANASQTMNLAQGNAAQLASMIGGMNQGSMTSNLGLNLNRRNDSLAAITQDRMDQLSDVNAAIMDAQAGRKDTFMQLMQQLQQTGWDQYVQNQQLQMQQQQHRKSMGGKKKRNKGKDRDRDKKRTRGAQHGGL